MVDYCQKRRLSWLKVVESWSVREGAALRVETGGRATGAAAG